MLIPATDKIKHILGYLSSLHLTNIPCQVVLLPEHDTVQGDTGEGFAVYIWGGACMYVAGNLSEVRDEEGNIIAYNEREIEEILFGNIAHEYIHHLQYCEGREPDEEEAERRSVELARGYFPQAGGE